MNNIETDVEKVIVASLGVSLLFWLYYLLAISWNPKILYFFLWFVLGGVPTYYFRENIKQWVNSSKINIVLRFFFAGYIMVLLEEILAALVNNLYEGFTPSVFTERILQFWAFNIFAFSGLFVAWFFLRRHFLYNNKEVFYITGIFGIYVELLSKGIGDVFSLALLAIPMIFVYGLIVTPMMLVAMPGEKRITNRVARYILPLMFIFICSIPFIFTLSKLRCAHPDAFPPREFIQSRACNS